MDHESSRNRKQVHDYGQRPHIWEADFVGSHGFNVDQQKVQRKTKYTTEKRHRKDVPVEKMSCDLKSYPFSYYATYSLGTSALYYTPFAAINDGWLENKFSYKFGFIFL